MLPNPTSRFSDRVAFYTQARPDYPPALIQFLIQECNLDPHSTIADIGSGTGILTRHFLSANFTIHAVEPNTPMREAAESSLFAFPNFHSINATAEATTLPDHSIDLIVAAQAFHWFDPIPTRREFQRILRPNGHAALIWNERIIDNDPFGEAYEQLLRDHAIDYGKVDHRNITSEQIQNFFAPAPVRLTEFPNAQHLDLAGLTARILSCSYAPPPGHPNHPPMLDAVAALFSRFQLSGKVTLNYTTRLHLAA